MVLGIFNTALCWKDRYIAVTVSENFKRFQYFRFSGKRKPFSKN